MAVLYKWGYQLTSKHKKKHPGLHIKLQYTHKLSSVMQCSLFLSRLMLNFEL